MKHKILAIIPARGGSKGLPRKNIKELCGKPLISYTIEAAEKSKYIDRVIVSTEDKEIAEISSKFGADIPFLRPEELATDNSPTTDCVVYTLDYLKNNEGYIPDYIALLQCTSPLRNSVHIDEAINKLIGSDMDGIISVCESDVNPYWMNIIKDEKLEYFIEEGRKITRRQDLPTVYRMNGALYIIKTDIFLKERTFEPEKVTAYVMGEYDSVDIDNALDFKIAETIMRERDEKNA